MPSYNILVLPGDGVGPEIMAEAIKILDVVSNRTAAKFNTTTALMGGCSIDLHGVALTDEVMQLAKSSHAVLFGAVGGPKWSVPNYLLSIYLPTYFPRIYVPITYFTRTMIFID